MADGGIENRRSVENEGSDNAGKRTAPSRSAQSRHQPSVLFSTTTLSRVGEQHQTIKDDSTCRARLYCTTTITGPALISEPEEEGAALAKIFSLGREPPTGNTRLGLTYLNASRTYRKMGSQERMLKGGLPDTRRLQQELELQEGCSTP